MGMCSAGSWIRWSSPMWSGTAPDPERCSPADWVVEMLAPWRPLEGPMAYGYLWWARPVRSPRGWEGSGHMSGNDVNIVEILRDYDAVITIQSANYNQPDAHECSFAIASETLTHLTLPSGGPR